MPVETLENGARLITPDTESASRSFACAGNFTVEWLAGPSRLLDIRSGNEMLLVASGSGGTIVGEHGSAAFPPMSVCILPAGGHTVSISGAGLVLVLATGRPDLDPGEALNADAPRDPRITPIGTPFSRQAPLRTPHVLPIDGIMQPEGNKRIRFIQTETMSINLVRYSGPRGKGALSPHAHDDIEQGTLAISGDYIHHLRKPWGADAAQWVEDAHHPAGPGSILLIPPEIIHTTEGVGAGEHFLLDIFAPPRRDFIAKGWVANALDYSAPDAHAPRCA